MIKVNFQGTPSPEYQVNEVINALAELGLGARVPSMG
jgi:hypothetical protein